MILLEEKHYLGYTKDHPKDAEFLNVPLENYEFMEAIFSTRQATKKYAMGFNEPLGVSIKVESSCKDGNGGGFVGMDGSAGFEFGVEGLATNTPSPSSSSRKRKKSSVVNQDDATYNTMSNAVREMASAIKFTVHAKRPLGLYKAVMDLNVFPLNHRLVVLDYLTENKGKGFNFMEMDEDVRIASIQRFISKNPDLL